MRYFLSVFVFSLFAAHLPADEFQSLQQPLGPVKPFSLTDQYGKPFDSATVLKDKIWVVNFFFTRCLAGCGRLIDNMADVQKHFAGNDNVVFVSITVDPDYDTPKVLYEYAEKKNIESPQWYFLTGEPDYVYELIQKTFLQSVQKQEGKDPGLAIVHTFFFLVIDKQSEIVGYVRDGRNQEETSALQKRLEEMLAGENPMPLLRRLNYLPTINASLNGTCGVFLVLGFFAIKRRWITFHKTCMLIAFAVSMVFLSCYVYYHFFFMRGSPTSFQGQGAVRTVYFAILISHTFLAAIVTPLAIWTVVLGLRDNRATHMRFARWTFPLWLYVSVTGVVIYVMLYHLYPPA